MRAGLDLEHWAAFQEGFAKVLDMVIEVARGERGPAPRTITFLSGDVHNSLRHRDRPTRLAAGRQPRSCRRSAPRSATRCRAGVRVAQSLLAKALARPLRFLVARTAKVPSAPYNWPVTEGPWFDNNLATLEVRGPRAGAPLGRRGGRGETDDAPELRQVCRAARSVPS